MSTHTQASSEEQRHHELVRRKLMRAIKRGLVEDAERLLVDDSDPCLLQLRPCEQPGSPLHLAVALACWGPPPSVCLVQRWCRTLGRALLPSFLSSSHLLHHAQHHDHHPKEQQQQQQQGSAAAAEDAERRQQELPSSSSSSTDGEAEEEEEENQHQARRSRGTSASSSRAAAESPGHARAHTAGVSGAQQLLRACGRERQALVSLLLSCGCDPFLEDGEGATALDLATSRWDRRLMRHPGHLVWTQNKQACDQVLSMLQPHAYFAAQLRAQVRPFGSQDWCHVRVMLAPRRRSSSPLDLAASATGAAADNGAAGAGGDLGAAAPYTCELWMFACEPGARVLAVVPLQGAHVQAIHLPSLPTGTQPAPPVPTSNDSGSRGAAGVSAQPPPQEQESQRRYRVLALQLPPPQQQQPGGDEASPAGQRGDAGGAFRRVRCSKAEFNPSFLQPIRSSSPQATHHDTHGMHEGLGRGGYMLALKPMDPGDSFACAQFDALCALLLGGRRQLPHSSIPAGAAPGSTRPGALDAAHIDASFRRLCRPGAGTAADPSPPAASLRAVAAAAPTAEVAPLAPAVPLAPLMTPAAASPPPAGACEHSGTRVLDVVAIQREAAAPAAAELLRNEEGQSSGAAVACSGAGVVPAAERCISAPAPPAPCSSAPDNNITTVPTHDPPRSRLALTAVPALAPAAVTPPTSNSSGRSSASSAGIALQRQQQQRQQLQQVSPASLLTSGWGVPHVCPDGMACGHTPLAHLFMREAAAEQQRRRAALRLPTRAQLVAHRRTQQQQQQHRRQQQQQQQRQSEEQQQEEDGAAIPGAMEISPAVSAAPVPPAASSAVSGMRLFSSTWEGEATPSCVVCMDEAPSLGFRHAGTVHACVCYTCAELLVSKHQQQGCSSSGHAHQCLLEPLLCPVCRQQVDEVVLV